MRKFVSIILIVFYFANFLFAQTKKTNAKTCLVKTNLFNIPFIPSFHIEQQLNNKGNQSIQFNFHYAKFVFISQNRFVNSSIDYRYYFPIKTSEKKLYGFYISPGIHYHYNFLNYRTIDTSPWTYKKGQGDFGFITRIGHQFTSKNNKWYLDLGVGLKVSAIPFPKENFYFKPESELRAMLAIGYKFL